MACMYTGIGVRCVAGEVSKSFECHGKEFWFYPEGNGGDSGGC